MTRPGRVLDEPPASARENLAVDEAIYQCMTSKQFPVTLRFWRNTGSAILGRSQAARDEVHEDACALHGVEIARRFSGGGTVYMDKGTLVVSFFVQKSLLPGGIPVQSVNDLFSRLLVSSLERASGSKFTTRDTTSIFHDGCKISGGAGHHDATRVLHHATVLVHADLEVLASVLVACEHVPLIPGALLVLIEGETHTMLFENGRPCKAAVVSFLKKLEQTPEKRHKITV